VNEFRSFGGSQFLDDAIGVELDEWAMAFLSTAFISLSPIVVLFFVPIFKKVTVGKEVKEIVNEPLLKVLVAFAVGGLLGDVFLHLIPHSFQPHSHGHEHENAHGRKQFICCKFMILIFNYFFFFFFYFFLFFS